MTQTSEPQFIGSAKPFGSTARIYRKRGWTGIFPLPAREKHPPPNGITGRRGVFADDDKLIEWLNDTTACKGNIGIRLGNAVKIDGAESDGEEFEVIGIDVDDHRDDPLKPKVGGEQLQYLEQKYGELPNTWTSSSRADGVSGIRFFLVPKGLAYRGNCGEHGGDIDIIQRVHRYAVVYPSFHPKGGQYLWYPPGVKPSGMNTLIEYYAELEKKAKLENNDLVWKDDPDQKLDLSEASELKESSVEGISHIPWVQELAHLPEKWIEFLTRGGTKDKAVKIDGSEYHIGADLDSSTAEINAWAKSTLPEPNERYQEFGGACKRMRGISNLWVDRLENAGNLHPVLIEAHNNILRYGLEGHTGWFWACEQANDAFLTALRERDDSQSRVKSARSEISRSYYGVLRKLKAEVDENEAAGLNIVGYCDCYEDTVSGFVNDADSGGGSEPPINDDDLEVWQTDAKDPNLYDKNEDGNAHHFADLHKGMLRYSINFKKWIVWAEGSDDGAAPRWIQVDGGRVHNLFRRVVKRQIDYAKQQKDIYDRELAIVGNPRNVSAAGKAAGKRAERWFAWAERGGMSAVVTGSLKQAQSINGIETRQEEWDSDPLRIGVLGGIIDCARKPEKLKPGQKPYRFIENKKDYMITMNTNVEFVEYDEQANHPHEEVRRGYEMFNNYLDTFIPDHLRHFLQKLMGYSLLGGNPERLIAYFYGPTSTGKSTLLNLARASVGEYGTTVDPSIFENRNFNTELAVALPKRLAVSSESNNRNIEAGLFKRIMGNEEISVPLKNSNIPIKMKPQFMIIMATNDVPPMPDVDEAVLRRVVVFPFEQQVDAEHDDKHAADDLLHSGKIACLAWMVQGLGNYLIEGLDSESWPEDVKLQTRDFTSQFDEFSEFLESCLEPELDSFVSVTDAWRAYEQFKGYIVGDMTQIKFSKKLAKLGYKKIKTRVKNEPTWAWANQKLKVKLAKA